MHPDYYTFDSRSVVFRRTNLPPFGAPYERLTPEGWVFAGGYARFFSGIGGIQDDPVPLTETEARELARELGLAWPGDSE